MSIPYVVKYRELQTKINKPASEHKLASSHPTCARCLQITLAARCGQSGSRHLEHRRDWSVDRNLDARCLGQTDYVRCATGLPIPECHEFVARPE